MLTWPTMLPTLLVLLMMMWLCLTLRAAHLTPMVLAPTQFLQLSPSPSIATASSTPVASASHQTTCMALTLITLTLITLTLIITTLAERPAGRRAGHATLLRGRHIMGQRLTILQSRPIMRLNRHTLHLRPLTSNSITSMASSLQVLTRQLNLLPIMQLMISTTLSQI